MKEKLYAVINKDNIVIDGWMAESFKEAKTDNPGNTIVEMTLANSPAHIGGKWDGKVFYRKEE